jgi:hypothetical protein
LACAEKKPLSVSQNAPWLAWKSPRKMTGQKWVLGGGKWFSEGESGFRRGGRL